MKLSPKELNDLELRILANRIKWDDFNNVIETAKALFAESEKLTEDKKDLSEVIAVFAAKNSALATESDRLRQEAANSKQPCKWVGDDDYSVYDTACGVSIAYDDDPRDYVKYCQHCGKPVEFSVDLEETGGEG